MITILFQLCIHFAWTTADNATRYEFAVKDSIPPKEIYFVDEPTTPYCAQHLYEPTTVQVWGLRADPLISGGVEYSKPSGTAVFEWQLDMSGADKEVGFKDFGAFVWAVRNPTPEELARFDTDGSGGLDMIDFARFRAAYGTCVSANGVRQVPCS